MAEDTDTSQQGLDPNNADLYSDTPLSPLQSINGGTDSSPTDLGKMAASVMPSRDVVEAKRQALMEAYQKLMDAQAYHTPAVLDPALVAQSSASLMKSGNAGLEGLAQGQMAYANAKQAEQDKQIAAQQAQAGTGVKMGDLGTAATTEDMKNAMTMLNQKAITDYKNNTLDARYALAGMNRYKPVKDQSGNVIGTIDGQTGQMVKQQGATDNSDNTSVSIPGVNPSSVEHQGLSQIILDSGIDPNSLNNRTRPELAQATKDLSGSRDALNGAMNASRVANQVQTAVNNGFPGGALGGVESGINAMLPAADQFSGPAQRDYINKKSNEMSTALVQSMHNSRIGVGMENFLKNSTFNPDMGVGAINKILSNYKDLPYVATANSNLENLTNKLPSAAKDAVYNEFLSDNPPYIEDPNSTDPNNKDLILNPAYKDKAIVKNWLAKRAGGGAPPAQPAPPSPAANGGGQAGMSDGVAKPLTKADYDSLPSGTQYFNPHTKSVQRKP